MFERVDCLQVQCFTDRHGTTHDHAVVHGVYHVHLIGSKELPDQEIPAQPLCVVGFRILRMGSVTQFIICFHILNI